MPRRSRRSVVLRCRVASTVVSLCGLFALASLGLGLARDGEAHGAQSQPRYARGESSVQHHMKVLGAGACRGPGGVDDYNSFTMQKHMTAEDCKGWCASHAKCVAADFDSSGNCFLFDSVVTQAVESACSQPCTCWLKEAVSRETSTPATAREPIDEEQPIESSVCTSLDGPFCHHINGIDKRVVQHTGGSSASPVTQASPDSSTGLGNLIRDAMASFLDSTVAPTTTGGTFAVEGAWQKRRAQSRNRQFRQTTLELRAGSWVGEEPIGWITAGFQASLAVREPNRMDVILIDESREPWGYPLEHCTPGTLRRVEDEQLSEVNGIGVYGKWIGEYECNDTPIKVEMLLQDPSGTNRVQDSNGEIVGTVTVHSTRVRPAIPSFDLEQLLNGEAVSTSIGPQRLILRESRLPVLLLTLCLCFAS